MSADARAFRRLFELAAPTASAFTLRGSQLLLLVALARVPPQGESATYVAAFGVLGALAVMSDSGAGNFLLSEGSSSSISAATLRRVLILHSSVASLGSIVAVIFGLLAFSPSHPSYFLVVIGALASSQAIDSCVRVCRTPLLLAGKDALFAGTEGVLAVGKCAIVVSVLATHSLDGLVLLPALSIAVLLLSYWSSVRVALRSGSDFTSKVTYRSILPYGMNGAASALYSQTPILISALLMDVSDVATLTLAYRLVQPLEILPATVGQQAIPRLRSGRASLKPLLLGLALAGALLGTGLAVSQELIERVLSVKFEPRLLFVIVCAALPVKFANYALAAQMMASGIIMEKLKITLLVGLTAVPAIAGSAMTGSVLGVVAVSLCIEIFLAGSLARALRREMGVQL